MVYTVHGILQARIPEWVVLPFSNNKVPKIRVPEYMKQMLTAKEGEIDGNTIIVADFNTPLTSKDRLSRQKIRKCRP